MTSDSSQEAFVEALNYLSDGYVEHFLRKKKDHFPCWIDLVSTSSLHQGLAELINDPKSISRGKYKETQVQNLASRLILARDKNLFSNLRRLWLAFDSSETDCEAVETAIQAALDDWPSEILKLPEGDIKFSSACAEFKRALQKVGESDREGVLGKAIGTSSIVNIGKSDRESLDVGFPLVPKGEKLTNLMPAIWVRPSRDPVDSPCEKLDKEWEQVWSEVRKILPGVNDESESKARLRNWIHEFAKALDLKLSFPSAGFSLAMQELADRQDESLPFGLGFTGCWEADQLQGVRDLSEKMQAAKEAGIFLLFACRDPKEPEPVPVDGVRLALLPEGMCLKEVVGWVNRVCADTGLTEDRWRKVHDCHRSSRSGTNVTSPNLPNACKDVKRYPVDIQFDMEKGNLARFNRELAASTTCPEAALPGRQLFVVEMSMRSGKTTLLNKFASNQSLYPIWFSFRRGQLDQQTLVQLRERLSKQLIARFHVVPSPSTQTKLSHEPNKIIEILESTPKPIDLLIDGVDEITVPNQQRDVLEWLQQLPGVGTVIVGSQPIPRLTDVDRRLPLENNSEPGRADARKLIEAFASHFCEQSNQRLDSIALKLKEDFWIDGLTKKAGGNPWVLSEYLSAVKQDPTVWCKDLADVPLTPDIKKYCTKLIKALVDEYSKDDQPIVKKFLAFLSFLGNRSWKLNDVLRVIDDPEVTDADWSESGLLGAAERILKFTDGECEFCSIFSFEAAQHHCKGQALQVTGKFIQYIEENSSSQDELLDHLIESIAPLLVELGDSKLTHTLVFETDWLYRRMQTLVKHDESIAVLLRELRDLVQSVSDDCRKEEIHELVRWLDNWYWRIDDSADLIDQWWHAAGRVIKPFKRPDAASSCLGETTLLVPLDFSIQTPVYDISWPAQPNFTDSACELMHDSASFLVVADATGGIFVYCRSKDEYKPKRPRIPLPENFSDYCVTGLAAGKYPHVFVALANRWANKYVVWKLNVSDGEYRQLFERPSATKLVSTFGNGFNALIAYRSEYESTGLGSLQLDIHDFEGERQFEIETEVSLKRTQGPDPATQVLPFGNSGVAVSYGAGSDRRQLKAYRLEKRVSHPIELQNSERVLGALVGPNNFLVWTSLSSQSDVSFVNWLDPADGKVTSECLYRDPDEIYDVARKEAENKKQPRRQPRSATNKATPEHKKRRLRVVAPRPNRYPNPLLHCEPLGWLRTDEVVLGKSKRAAFHSMRLARGETPQKLSDKVVRYYKGVEPDFFKGTFRLQDGRELQLYEAGGVIIDFENEAESTFGEGRWRPYELEKLCLRQDGHLIAFWEGPHPNGYYERKNVKLIEAPQNDSTPVQQSKELANNTIVTLSGWELCWEGAVLKGRRTDEPLVELWNAEDCNDDSDVDPEICDIVDGQEACIWVLDRVGETRRLTRVNTCGWETQKKWVIPPELYTDQERDRSSLYDDAYDNVSRVIKIVDGLSNFAIVEVLWGTDEDFWGGDSFLFDAVDEKFIPLSRDGWKLVSLGESAVLLLRKPGFSDKELSALVYKQGWVDYSNQSNSGLHSAAFVVKPADTSVSSRCKIACMGVVDARPWRKWELLVREIQIGQECSSARISHRFGIELSDLVVAWDFTDGILALAFASGRIECRCIDDDLKEVRGVGYYTSAPTCVKIICRNGERFIVAIAGGEDNIQWYPLPENL